jgi:hypothetical protein
MFVPVNSRPEANLKVSKREREGDMVYVSKNTLFVTGAGGRRGVILFLCV